MKRKILITCLLVLTLFVGVAVAQRIRKHGALVDATSAGAVTISSKSGQTITLTGATAHVGASTFSSTVGITGAATVGGTLGVTGATTLTGGVTVGTGNALTKLAKYTATLSPAEVAANTCAEELFTVTGVTASDILFVNKPTAQAGLGIGNVRAAGADSVGITFCNNTGSPITPTASQVYSFGAIR